MRIECLFADGHYQRTGFSHLGGQLRVAAVSSAAGTASLRVPNRQPSARHRLSREQHAEGAFRPMARVSATIGVVQKSPIFTPGVANQASSAAMARSQAATSWQPAAVATPCTCGDDGLRNRVDLQHQLAANVEDLAVCVDVAAGHLGEIVAGAEDFAGSGENDGADFAVAADFVQRGDAIPASGRAKGRCGVRDG